VAAGVVGAVLMLAGVAKLAGPVPRVGLPTWVESLLPWIELTIGALVVAGFRVAAGAAFLLLAGFTGWLARQLLRGDRRPCGCFGETAGRPVSGWSIGRNLGLMGAAAIAMAGVDGPSGWPGPVAGAVLGVLLVVAESRAGTAT
jgi:hypothetical protein